MGFFGVDVCTFINAVLHRCFSRDMSCFKIMHFFVFVCLLVCFCQGIFVCTFLYIFMNTVSILCDWGIFLVAL